MSSNGSNSHPHEEDWHLLVTRYAGIVWQEIHDSRLSEQAAIGVNRLTWMRLADHLGELEAVAIEPWLRRTARDESTRYTRLEAISSELDPLI